VRGRGGATLGGDGRQYLFRNEDGVHFGVAKLRSHHSLMKVESRGDQHGGNGHHFLAGEERGEEVGRGRRRWRRHGGAGALIIETVSQ
jgi:hypothetical protein